MSRPIIELITIAKQNQLEGAEILDDYSYLELARIYNGIGPARFPDWLREIVTEANGLFEPAALIHDVEYYLGGTKADFTAANREFKENCDTLVEAAYAWYDPRRYKWLFRAWRYANYCEDFGWSGFHKIGEKCECTRCKPRTDTEKTEKTEKTEDAEDKATSEAAEAVKEVAGAEKCAGCENCTCGKHEPEAEPVEKPKTKKKTRKGKKK